MNRITLLLVIVSSFAALPAAAATHHRRVDADARYCLDRPTYYAIIKCAEKFL